MRVRGALAALVLGAALGGPPAARADVTLFSRSLTIGAGDLVQTGHVNQGLSASACGAIGPAASETGDVRIRAVSQVFANDTPVCLTASVSTSCPDAAAYGSYDRTAPGSGVLGRLGNPGNGSFKFTLAGGAPGFQLVTSTASTCSAFSASVTSDKPYATLRPQPAEVVGTSDHPYVGQTIHAVHARWALPTPALTDTWLHGCTESGSGCSTAVADADSYTIPAGDVGGRLRLAEGATLNGFSQSSSSLTGPVLAAPPYPVYVATTSSGEAITPGSTPVGIVEDDTPAKVQLPFDVSLFGRSYGQAQVSPNGTLQFDSASHAFAAGCAPDPAFGGPVIFAGYDDLVTTQPGTALRSSVTGTPGARVLHIEWQAEHLGDATHKPVNFEARLYEDQPRITLVYGVTSGVTAGVVGLQESPVDGGLGVSCGKPLPAAGTRIDLDPTRPAVTGDPAVGAPLTATSPTWAGTAPVAIAYGWERCAARDVACAPIAGATQPTYTPGSADAGRFLRVAVSGTNLAGSATVRSASSAAVAGGGVGDGTGTTTPTDTKPPDPPPLAGRLTLGGTPRLVQGRTLQVRVACADAACAGRLTGTAKGAKRRTLSAGSATVKLAAGAKATLRLRLPAATRRRLAAKRRLVVTLAYRPTGTSTATLTKRTTLRKRR